MVALSEVMGGPISAELTGIIWASLGVEIAPHIENKFNFSQFSGIAAFCERIYCWQFCKGDNAGPSSPKVTSVICFISIVKFLFQSEIEKADFDKLLAKLDRTNIPEVLKAMLLSLKDSGQPKPGCIKPRRKFSKNQNIFDFL